MRSVAAQARRAEIQGRRAHLVRRRLLGLGIPRGRPAQRASRCAAALGVHGARGDAPRDAARHGAAADCTRAGSSRACAARAVRSPARRARSTKARCAIAATRRMRTPSATGWRSCTSTSTSSTASSPAAGCGRSMRRNLAEFRRSDYLGPPELPLAEAVRDCVERATGHAAARPRSGCSRICAIAATASIRSASTTATPRTPARCRRIVAEITNTPWQRASRLRAAGRDARRRGVGAGSGDSPRPSTSRRSCRWSATTSGASPCRANDLRVHMDVLRRAPSANSTPPWRCGAGRSTAASLRRVLLRYPLMTAQVVAAIYWQALRLWLQAQPRPRPSRHSEGGSA